jgi:CheY-like chemotaxis protein
LPKTIRPALLHDYLESIGYRVELATDGTRAIETLTVTSLEGEGSTFTVLIPRVGPSSA